MKLEFYLKIFEKKKDSRIMFLENPSSGSRVIPCGQMDRRADGQTEGKSRFSKFYKSNSKAKKIYKER
jgi:hypothetical protein